MKSLTLAIALLLLVGTFATAFVLAEEATEVSQLESVEATTSEIQEVTSEVAEQTQNFKRVGFTDIWRGNGWATNEEKGSLIYGFWAHQAYSKNGETDVKHLTFGKLKIAKVGSYRLVKTAQTDVTDSFEFYLIPLGTKITKDTAGANSVGTLSLNKDKEYTNLVTWSGTLQLNSGENQGSYEVKLGTIKNTVRPVVAKAAAGAIQDAKQAGKVSFWKRMQFWRNRNSE
jgi:hypothetical protein